MNRADAYAVLSRELRAWQQRPYEQIAAIVGQPPSETIVRVGQEDVTVCVGVQWADERKGTLRVEATAAGPSCWALERLEESIIVSPAKPIGVRTLIRSVLN